MASSENLPERNPPWTPKLPQRLIARLYLSDSKGIVEEELLNEVGYGLFARCESMLIVTDASRGSVRCPRCGQMIVHTNNPKDLLKCKKCKWQKSWRAYQKTYKGRHLHPGGIEPFVRDYFEQFPKAKDARQKMLLIDRLLHRWHWEHKNNAEKASAPNFLEGSHDDVVAFLNALTYNKNNTSGLSESKLAWQKKPQEALALRLGGGEKQDVFNALKSADPGKRIEAIEALRALQIDPEIYVGLMKERLTDSNKKVRGLAVNALFDIAKQNEEKAKEFVPLLIPLLQDRSKKVRQGTARRLRMLSQYVPLKAAAQALLDEKHPSNRQIMESLLQAVLDINTK